MASFAGAIRGANLHFAKKEKREQQDRQEKRQEQLFKLTLDKSKREQAAFNSQQQYKDLFFERLKGSSGAVDSSALEGQNTSGGQDFPTIREADGVPRPNLGVGNKPFDLAEFLKDPTNLLIAQNAGMNLNEIAKIIQAKSASDARLVAGEDRLEEQRLSRKQRRDIFNEGIVPTVGPQGTTFNTQRQNLQPGSVRALPPLTRVDRTKGGVTTATFPNVRNLPTGGGPTVAGSPAIAPTGQPPGIQISDKKGLSAMESAKLKLTETGLQDVGEFQSILIDSAGKVNRKLLAEMKTNLPFSQGREANSLVLNAIESKLRAESGAAVPEEEVTRMMKKFVPSILDNDSTIKSKLRRLTTFLAGTVEAIDPNKTYTFKFKDESGNDLGVPSVTKGTPIDNATIDKILDLAGGDFKKAEKVARDLGYKF